MTCLRLVFEFQWMAGGDVDPIRNPSDVMGLFKEIGAISTGVALLGHWSRWQ
jgi:hypothetical protein